MRRLAVAVPVLIALAAGACDATATAETPTARAAAEPAPPAARPAAPALPVASAARDWLAVSGKVVGQGTDVIADAAGTIAFIEAERGVRVRAGDPLARIAAGGAVRELRAPIDGVITGRWVSAGDAVAAGHRVATLVADGPRTVELRVPADEASRIAVGNAVEIAPVALRDQVVTATLTRLGREVSAGSGMITAEVALAPDPRLLPGMFVHARVALGVPSVTAAK